MTRIELHTDSLMGARQAWTELGIGKSTFYRWLENGTLHPIRIGPYTLVAKEEVEELKRRNGPAAKSTNRAGEAV